MSIVKNSYNLWFNFHISVSGKMSEQFLGCTVSVKCIDDLAYQGKIIDLNKNSLTLAKAFCNGIPHTSSIVNLRYICPLDLFL